MNYTTVWLLATHSHIVTVDFFTMSEGHQHCT